MPKRLVVKNHEREPLQFDEAAEDGAVDQVTEGRQGAAAVGLRDEGCTGASDPRGDLVGKQSQKHLRWRDSGRETKNKTDFPELPGRFGLRGKGQERLAAAPALCRRSARGRTKIERAFATRGRTHSGRLRRL